MDALKNMDAFSYEKMPGLLFEVLILNPLPCVVENTHDYSMLLTLDLGTWHALDKRLVELI